MALAITKTPPDYSSAHGALVYNVYESVKALDPVTYTGYKYIADVYVSGVLITRQEAAPHPVSKKGVFNFGSIVRNFVKMYFNPSGGTIEAAEFGSGNFYAEVVIKFGEYYGGTSYLNVTIDSARRYYNYYTGRIFAISATLTSFQQRAASTRPYLNITLSGSSFQFIPYFSQDGAPFDLVITSYLENGTIQATHTRVITPTAGDTLQQLNVSEQAINGAYAGTINSSTYYYIVKIGDTSEYRFNIVYEAIYQTVSLSFFNQFGGWETFEFSKLSKRKRTLEKKSFEKIPYDNEGVYYAGNVINPTFSVYDVGYTESFKINTNNIKELTYKWLFQLVASPLILFLESGLFVHVEVEETEFDFKTRINDKVFNLPLTLIYRETIKTQYQ